MFFQKIIYFSEVKIAILRAIDNRPYKSAVRECFFRHTEAPEASSGALCIQSTRLRFWPARKLRILPAISSTTFVLASKLAQAMWGVRHTFSRS